MQPARALLSLALCAALAPATTSPIATAAAAPPKPVEIAYDEFTLPNGLRVLVHTDRKAPIVAVNIWYHVGSKDEPLGRSGFAHLFEHLMFQGSENHKGEFFEPFELVGATDQNGTTNSDRTNYFENVPTTALDMALWMESDRMGHLLGAIDQAVLDEQRGVVQNEKRQGENQPYGQVFERLTPRRTRRRTRTTTRRSARWPISTPPRSTTSRTGSRAGTARTTRCWCWPATSTSPPRKAKVARYFGDIAPTAKVPKQKPQIAARKTSTRETMTDQVPQTRIYRVWNIPQTGTVDADRLQARHVLGGARSSRLDRRLVHQDKLADSGVAPRRGAAELGGIFFVQADVKRWRRRRPRSSAPSTRS
jgi:zinc protease